MLNSKTKPTLNFAWKTGRISALVLSFSFFIEKKLKLNKISFYFQVIIDDIFTEKQINEKGEETKKEVKIIIVKKKFNPLIFISLIKIENTREIGLENQTRLFRNLKSLFLALIAHIFIKSCSKTRDYYSARQDLSIDA